MDPMDPTGTEEGEETTLSSTNRWNLDPEKASRLHVAAVVGRVELARELELTGICTEDESLEEARELCPGILKTMDSSGKDWR